MTKITHIIVSDEDISVCGLKCVNDWPTGHMWVPGKYWYSADCNACLHSYVDKVFKKGKQINQQVQVALDAKAKMCDLLGDAQRKLEQAADHADKKADHYMEKADAAKEVGLDAMHLLDAERSQVCRELAVEIRSLGVGDV